MKEIMLSIRPEWVAKILNGEKTIEVRRKFPKDYKGWVYIYCTKGTPKTQLIDNRNINNKFELCWCLKNDREQLKKHIVNGKIVAEFDSEVEEINVIHHYETTSVGVLCYDEVGTKTLDQFDLLQKSCLTRFELSNYLGAKGGYAIHIKNLKVFDKPKELSEFSLYRCNTCDLRICSYCDTHLTKAPQNYCYVEVEKCI